MSINLSNHTKEYWNNFYKKDIKLSESTFCTKVQSILSPSSFIVDIGCGSGRDTFAFASSGIDVFGIDGSEEAIQSNKTNAIDLGLSNKVTFATVDLSEKQHLKKMFEKIKLQAEESDQEITLYMRFLLHAIDENTESILLETISDTFAMGTKLAAEFRTVEDEKRSKIYDDHYRRFLNTDIFLSNLNSKGFLVKDFFKGTGLSIYKGEDPFLARVIAEKR